MDAISDNYTTPLSKLSETTCEICESNPGKYRCPRCQLVSCSLPCSKSHKIRDKCSGVRNRSAYVRRSEYDMNKLSSDIGLLEDAARICSGAHKLMKTADPMVHKEPLVLEANKRRVDLRLLAEWFPKRQENKSFYDFRARKMFWSVKWIVRSGEDGEDSAGESVVVLKHRCMDQAPLLGLIKNLPHTPGISAADKERLSSMVSPKLEAAQVEAFLLQDPAYTRPQFLTLPVDPLRNLRGLLSGKIVVEYPAFLIKIKPAPPVEEIPAEDGEVSVSEMDESKEEPSKPDCLNEKEKCGLENEPADSEEISRGKEPGYSEADT